MFKQMVRVSLMFVVSAIFFLSAQQTLAEAFSIRGFQWGASGETIKAGEKAPLKRETANGAVKYLIYTDTFVGESVSVVYRLIHDRLFEVTQQFENNGRDCKEMSTKFDAVVSELSAKNGQPVTPAATNTNPCNATRVWEMGDTTLTAHLSSDSGKVDLAVSATSKELAKLAEQITFTK